VRVLKRQWPECKSFSGAVDKYLTEALQALELAERRGANSQQAREQHLRQRDEQQRRADERARREQLWQALGEEERQRISADVLAKHPQLKDHAAILHALCLSQLTVPA